MTENQREWLGSLHRKIELLYDEEIVQADVARRNELLWAKGAPDETAREMHLPNSKEQTDYISILEKLKDGLDIRRDAV